jgi:hypothetical protein
MDNASIHRKKSVEESYVVEEEEIAVFARLFA